MKNINERERFFLSVEGTNIWTEVTERKFIEAERKAGFHPKTGNGVCTGGFNAYGVHGRVIHFDSLTNFKKQYEHDPIFIKAVEEANKKVLTPDPVPVKPPKKIRLQVSKEHAEKEGRRIARIALKDEVFGKSPEEILSMNIANFEDGAEPDVYRAFVQGILVEFVDLMDRVGELRDHTYAEVAKLEQ